MKVDVVSWSRWPHCLRLRDEHTEVVVPTDVGPRILRFGRPDGPNLLHETPKPHGSEAGTAWQPHGGHRLWHAPEVHPRTYAPDNDPVTVEVLEDCVVLTQATETSTGIQKQLELRLDAGRLTLIHRLANRNPWTIELAPWAITMMAAGGFAILPQEPFAPHPHDTDGEVQELCGGDSPSYLPNRTLALWSYTRLNDPRWRFFDRHLLMMQDPEHPSPLKFGLSSRLGWCAYQTGGDLFLKRFQWKEQETYPDRGCNCEVFVNGEMLELESLGPLVALRPDAVTEHQETWIHAHGLTVPRNSLDIAHNLAPLLAELP